MKKLSCLLLVTLTLLGSFTFFSVAHASTNVTNLIASDTTWNDGGSPYELTGPICVMTGATLTVEPGVTVDIGGYYILINGTLDAQGTSNNKITFETSNPTTGAYSQQIQFAPSSTNSIIQNAVIYGASILAKSCALRVSNSYFEGSKGPVIQSLNGGSLTVTGNVFHNIYAEGVSAGGSSTVTGNLFNITTGYATAIVAHENTYASGNEILGFYRGIYADGSGTVEGNTIENCIESGLVCSGTGTIQDNYVSNCQVGVLYSCGTVQNNALVQNQVGVSVGTWEAAANYMNFVNNNIVGSTRYSANITNNYDANIPNNWWGTTDVDAVNQTIWDFKDDFTLGVLSFTPVLNSPSPNAPTAPSSPNISVTAPSQTQTSEANPTQGTGTQPTDSSTPLSTTPNKTQNPAQNPISGQLNNSNVIQLATLIVLVIVALLLAALIILTIRKRTSSQHEKAKAAGKSRRRSQG